MFYCEIQLTYNTFQFCKYYVSVPCVARCVFKNVSRGWRHLVMPSPLFRSSVAQLHHSPWLWRHSKFCIQRQAPPCMEFFKSDHWSVYTIGGSRVACLVHTPPTGPNSFVFAYILAKSAHIRGPRSPLTGPYPLQEILDPPLCTITLFTSRSWVGMRAQLPSLFFCHPPSGACMLTPWVFARISQVWLHRSHVLKVTDPATRHLLP